MNKKAFLIAIATLLVISLACNVPGQTAPTPTPPPEGAAATAAVQTYQAIQSETARAGGSAQQTSTDTLAPGAPSDTPLPPSDTPAPPTITTEPSQTPSLTPSYTPSLTPTITQTAIPCNWVQFVSDVTVPDETRVFFNSTFTKTWRLKNIGSCTWTSGYKLIFDHGDQMNAPGEVQLTPGTVAPGGTIDVSVSLKAPATEGTYQGFFRLKSSDGQIFGIGNTADKPFWVKIISFIPTLPPPAIIADLVITDISWSPSTIHDDTPIHFKVKFRNQGGVDAGNFTIRFWARSTFANVSCAWAVPGLAAGDGEEATCDFTFASWYAPGQTKAIIDVHDDVHEVNEGNNTYLEPIEVNP